MQSIDTHFLSQISGGRDRSFRSPQFQSHSGWSVKACTYLGYVNDTLSVGAFTAGFIPGGKTAKEASFQARFLHSIRPHIIKRCAFW